MQPVFDAIAESGQHLFDGATVWVAMRDGEMIRAAAITERDPQRLAAGRPRSRRRYRTAT